MTDLQIPIGILPLGTGNDMARHLQWGSGFNGLRGVSRFMEDLMRAPVEKLDRWKVQVTPTCTVAEASKSVDRSLGEVQVSTRTPHWNNYFSIGADAHVALKFDLARKANPNGFKSRMMNQLFYGIEVGKDAFLRRHKRLSEHIELKCDGKDYTNLIRKKRHSMILFLNIGSYGAGMNPWGTRGEVDCFRAPSINDGTFEVIGFSGSWQMGFNQINLTHGTRIAQCKNATIITQ